MFDFAWSEMAVIAAVALVLIGPKDMPVAIRTITGMIKKARRMAGEFQTHVDEMLREANLDEVKNTINDIRNFDLKSEMERTSRPDGTLRDTFASNPLEPDAGRRRRGGRTRHRRGASRNQTGRSRLDARAHLHPCGGAAPRLHAPQRYPACAADHPGDVPDPRLHPARGGQRPPRSASPPKAAPKVRLRRAPHD